MRRIYDHPDVDLRPYFPKNFFVVVPIPFKGVNSGFFDRRSIYHNFTGV
ncbi:MAG: hypothetical protein IM597_00815 [Pseudanabaena sp. M176S2SP2A07QC]|nr:hypothetical protein [Pseudanabaena sp. M090S1SP2A07QC]MCA6505311.1 hypothetical protein [Pseudanabaena sp. M172S2SP2A07QC]MCA6521716.1 hypothetical protein [Pseudanabaena sp. M051S1SP2A07QC]MCA6527886.1 hypothetical protein [Pseudanabaena sp. M179S2SP2A07QC]MCA6532754.1 hypothetical protein [Pseudanabaena sp. M176S2SP2A07QC]MCA6563666.1 hypothetical protein [Pseudanabaena sp. M151S2SP2A07QC]MCA6575907.1 hypothetical protein [Pseudanabaena sp. M085S1SP2A07QC]